MKTILVVDDYAMNLKMAEFALKSKYNVICAESGAAALDVLSNNQVDFILLDVMMPDMDGFETLNAIKSNESFSNIPLCFLTGDTDETSIAKMNSLGVAYIEKPFDSSKLYAAIESAIQP